jgi:membrane protease YdiL (CAAX protease family)
MMYRKQFACKRPFPGKVYLVLIILTLLTIIAVQPYQLALQSITFEAKILPDLMLSVLTDTVIYSVLAGLGLFLATRIGLGLPFLEGLYDKSERWRRLLQVGSLSILVGVFLVILLLVVDQVIFKDLVLNDLAAQGLEVKPNQANQPIWWQTFLASFYGGISEEIQLRLFVLTVVVWLGSRLWQDEGCHPGRGVLWAATIVSTLVFGLGHLPMLSASLAAAGLSLTPVLILSTLTTNGIGGIILGWLYWSRGLESAMIAHFCADITLHMIVPAIVLLIG